MRQLEQISLELDEYEAIRLVDHEKMDLETAATHLKVSRATCARIVDSAHGKVAEALTEGKAILIDGGVFSFVHNRYRCGNCGHLWPGRRRELGSGMEADRTPVCPSCESDDVLELGDYLYQQRGNRGRGRGPAHGR